MNITLEIITMNEKEVLRNLYSLYLHDLSEFTDGLELSTNGSFEFDAFDVIWEQDGLSPYFVKANGKIAGFLLLAERPFLKKEYDFCINDIFILRNFRGNGIGKKVLKELFRLKKGTYVVLELSKNEPAVCFWKKIYRTFEIKVEEQEKVIDGDKCLVQSFVIS